VRVSLVPGGITTCWPDGVKIFRELPPYSTHGFAETLEGRVFWIVIGNGPPAPAGGDGEVGSGEGAGVLGVGPTATRWSSVKYAPPGAHLSISTLRRPKQSPPLEDIVMAVQPLVDTHNSRHRCRVRPGTWALSPPPTAPGSRT
jgi:hypothetical protein